MADPGVFSNDSSHADGSETAAAPPGADQNNAATPPDDHTDNHYADPSLPYTPGGSITLDWSYPPSSSLNPRSCVTCRKRKVRCDKHMPCSNCRKAQISCIFPAPGRAPRRPRAKDPKAAPKQTSEREVELMRRLRKLEGIVGDLSGQIEYESKPRASNSSMSPTQGDHSPQDAANGSPNPNPSHQRQTSLEGKPSSDPGVAARLGSAGKGPIHKDFGRLVINDRGKSRYISSAFWSKVNDEISELRANAQKLTDDEDDLTEDEGEFGSTPSTVHFHGEGNEHQSFIMGYSSSDVDLQKLHPLPSQIPFIWQVFVDNVDPLIKILHVPTIEKYIRELRGSIANVCPAMEALMFAIYYAAITSMEEEDVSVNFGAEKRIMVNKFRFATEQALAKANFLVTQEMTVVQALVIFLTLVRKYDDTRYAWTLTSLVVRLGQSLGLHIDGSHFGGKLSPFEIEMRRRLWWGICVLDLRAAEDQGTDLIIAERTHDTVFPLNVHDTDLHTNMKEWPPERSVPTSICFCLIRYELCGVARKLHSASSGMSACPRDSQMTMENKERMLFETYDRIEDKYLKTCSDGDSDILFWMSATIARLIMAKMCLIIYQPLLRPAGGEDLDDDVRDRLFLASVEVVEYNKVLNGEPKCKHWRWLFHTYTQWHAVAFALLEVCRRPWSSLVERAWTAMTATLEADATEYERLSSHSAIFLPMKKLMLRAKKRRDEELARLRSDPEAAQQMDAAENSKIPPASFNHLPSSMRSTMAQQRWRNLVGMEHLNAPASMKQTDVLPGFWQRVQEQKQQQQQKKQAQAKPISSPPLQDFNSEPPSQKPRHTPLPASDTREVRMDYVDQAMQQKFIDPSAVVGAALHGSKLSTEDEYSQLASMIANSMSQGAQMAPPSATQTPMMGGMPQGLPDGAFGAPNNAYLQPSNGITPDSSGGITSPSNGANAANTATQSVPTDDRPVSPGPWMWGTVNVVPNNLTLASAPTNNGNNSNNILSGFGLPDDGDINMDDDFNLQNWQDTLRNFDLNGPLGMGGMGFMGGV